MWFVLQLVTVEWFSRRILLLPAPHVFIHLDSSCLVTPECISALVQRAFFPLRLLNL